MSASDMFSDESYRLALHPTQLRIGFVSNGCQLPTATLAETRRVWSRLLRLSPSAFFSSGDTGIAGVIETIQLARPAPTLEDAWRKRKTRQELLADLASQVGLHRFVSVRKRHRLTYYMTTFRLGLRSDGGKGAASTLTQAKESIVLGHLLTSFVGRWVSRPGAFAAPPGSSILAEMAVL